MFNTICLSSVALNTNHTRTTASYWEKDSTGIPVLPIALLDATGVAVVLCVASSVLISVTTVTLEIDKVNLLKSPEKSSAA